MITVQILINDRVVICRSARNISPTPPPVGTPQQRRYGEWCLYHVDDGRELTHRREDGAIKLAVEMLKGVAEP